MFVLCPPHKDVVRRFDGCREICCEFIGGLGDWSCQRRKGIENVHRSSLKIPLFV